MAKAAEITEMDCRASVFDDARLILRARLEEMIALRENALDFSDIEGVHNMRVASRRLRGAFSDFAPFLRKKEFPRRLLKDVADALGSVRDEDVAIQALEKLQAKAKRETAAGIAQLADERRQRREHARTILREAISESALNRLRDKFEAGLERSARVNHKRAAQETGKHSDEWSLRRAGREIILARFTDLKNLSTSLHHPFEIERLHRMRIAAKRLRYGIELFSTCWGKSLARMAGEIAELQKSLGELHDCDVWIDDLGARLDRNHQAGTSEATTIKGDDIQVRQAAVWLLSYFTKERTGHFRDALARWHQWEATAFHARLVDSLDSDQTTIGNQSSLSPVSEDELPDVQSVPDAAAAEKAQDQSV